MRPSLRRASLRLGLLAGAVALLGACSGSGGAIAPSAATGSQVADGPSAAPSEAPSATASDEPSSGGGRGDADYDYGNAASAAVSPAPGPGTHRVNLASGSLGAYLTGDNGLTLYTFKPDSPNTSTCAAGCAQAWPPFAVGADDEIEAGDGVGGDLTTFARGDGSLQVAYDGAPLYSFANDTTPGDTNGQGQGDAWFVARP